MWQTHLANDQLYGNIPKLSTTLCSRRLGFTNQKEFIVEKVVKRKDNKLYVKWKGYRCYFNSWIDKKRCNINE